MKRKLPLLLESRLAELAAERIRQGTEGQLQALAQGPLTCKVGCASCCFYPVRITVLEGVLLYRTLVQRGRWGVKLREALRAHWDQVKNLSPEVWLLAAIECPLLDRGKCMGYAGRPALCRATWSHGDKENCHPHRLGVEWQGSPGSRTQELLGQQMATLREQGMSSLVLPVSLATLIGEKLAQGEIGPGDVDREVFVAYKGNP